jgi:hypothetical protein
VIETEQEKQWRRELESAGETAVRDSMNHGGGIATGGEPKRQYVFRWLREKEQERQRRESQSAWYVCWTYRATVATLVVAVLTFFAAIAAVVATVLHP